jgi:hypothetical protein
MDAMIIYLKDGHRSDKVEVSVELIGDPSQSFLLGNAIINRLSELKQTIFCDNEFTLPSPSDRLQ